MVLSSSAPPTGGGYPELGLASPLPSEEEGTMTQKLWPLAALLLALGLAAPARATTTTISTANTSPNTINADDEHRIVTGGSVTVTGRAPVMVNGGTLKMSGGSIFA